LGEVPFSLLYIAISLIVFVLLGYDTISLQSFGEDLVSLMHLLRKVNNSWGFDNLGVDSFLSLYLGIIILIGWLLVFIIELVSFSFL
jgi:hypothetical protein